MIGLLQRVSSAHVEVDGVTVGRIPRGLLVLVGIQPGDHDAHADRLLERILSYRVFPDEQDKMNLCLRDIAGGLLLVPQFTLAADTRKGTRPGFSTAATPAVAEALFSLLCNKARTAHANVAQGVFGANMQVHLVNDGPVTFWLHVPPGESA
jgi:D-aminoacyl-tRNA deacylase